MFVAPRVRPRLPLFAIGLGALLSSLGVPVAAPAQPTARPHRLTLESVNETPGWFVTITANNPSCTYVVGDEIRLQVESEREGYLYLFNIDAGGQVTCLFPNSQQRNNRIAAQTLVTVPGPEAGFQIKVTPEALGTEYIKAVVTVQPLAELDINRLARNVGGTAMEFAELRQILLRLATGKNFPRARALQVDFREAQDDLKNQNSQQAVKLSGQYAEANLTITTSQKSPITVEKRIGLFIGVNKFRDQSIRELGCCVNDAKNMEQAMRTFGHLTQTVVLTDERATLRNIRSEFDRIISSTRPGDTVFIYWSGHGGRCANVDGTEPDGLDAYLVPHDGSIASDSEARQTMLLDKTFGRWIQELAGRKVMVVLDTCHSGGQIEGMKSPRKVPLNPDGSPRFARGITFPRKMLPPSVNPDRWTKKHFLDTELNRLARMRSIGRQTASVLSACSFKQFAFERTQGDNGVMTYFILEALRQSSGPMRIRDLHNYVNERVQQYVNGAFPGSPQTPVFADEAPLAGLVRP